MGETLYQGVSDLVRQISIWAVPLLVAIVFHELAHGWVALKFGDPTAARMGRLTLNPLAHIDLMGTVLLPLFLLIARVPFLFGYAKPVPVNFYMLSNPKRDMIWVALAGPMMNLVLALASAFAVRILVVLVDALSNSFSDGFIVNQVLFPVLAPVLLMAEKSVSINLVLVLFNLLPVPPLDGGRVVAGLLPAEQANALVRIEPYGMLIVLVLLWSGSLDLLLGPVLHALLRVLF